jgi:teichoic acid transport system permease protein
MTTSTAAAGAASAPLVVYEPTSKGTQAVGPYVRGLLRRRPFMWELARSDLKAEHYDTVLGQVWLLLNPLLMAAVWLLVREVIRPVGTEENRQDIIAHLIIGIFMFQYTSGLISGGAMAVVSRKPMIMNSPFPRLVFPLVDLTKAAIELVPTVLVYAVISLWLGQPITVYLLWFPVIVVMQTMFSFGLGLILATLTVFVRDVSNFVRYVLRLWMFCSPILYTVAEIPPNMLKYLQLNPLFPYFAAYENIFDGVPPEPRYLLWGLAWGVATLAVGIVMFFRKERDFAIWL